MDKRVQLRRIAPAKRDRNLTGMLHGSVLQRMRYNGAMAHLTSRTSYDDLVARLNLAPQGAVPSLFLDRILGLLFSERDAALVAQLPLRPFTAQRAARIWRVGEAEAKQRLDDLAERSLLVDIVHPDGQTQYVLPPPMIGFFEFSLMRVRDNLDQRLLSELYEQYLTVEDDFMRALIGDAVTQQGRILVHEDRVSLENSLEILDMERASALIDSASDLAVGLCYCRHKRTHLGRACSAPLELCLSLNHGAATLIRHQVVRRIERSEAHELLQSARELNLVQFADNVQHGVNFICNCCSCCCEALTAARRFGLERPIHTSNFCVLVAQHCTGCGRCVSSCPVRILSLATEQPQGWGRKRVVVDETLCLGCGVCTRNCPRGALVMERRAQRVITPVNSTHKAVLMAVERGRLQYLLFDNRTLYSHRALAAVFGVILRLEPVKRLFAAEQLGSRYLAALCERYETRWNAP